MFVVDLVRYWAENRRIRKLLREAPTCPLAELPEDRFARIVGRVQPLDNRVLEAPLSGRLCVYYSIELVERRGSTTPRRLATEHEAIDFVLESGGARALVDPAHARISSGFDHTSESKAAFDANVRQRALLERHALIQRNWFGTHAIRYREAVLAVDERVAILGAGTREPDPSSRPVDRGYREGGPTRMRFTGTAKHPLVISDDPRSL